MLLSDLHPWIPALLPDRGEVNVSLDPQMHFSGVYISNYFGNITVSDVHTTVLVATARQVSDSGLRYVGIGVCRAVDCWRVRERL